MKWMDALPDHLDLHVSTVISKIRKKEAYLVWKQAMFISIFWLVPESSKKSEIRKDEIDYAANSSMKWKSDKQSQKST